jgi:hypothetical protein
MDNIELEFGFELKIDLESISNMSPNCHNSPCSPICFKRGENSFDNIKEKNGWQKYFRQPIQIYNKSGVLVDSGFVRINDYNNMWKMIRVLPKNKKCLHVFDHDCKVGKYIIRDLASGQFISECHEIPDDIPYGDLQKDKDYLYSQILMDCLEKYNLHNKPNTEYQCCPVISICNSISNSNSICNCNCQLFERLEIINLFENGAISEEEQKTLLNKLTCVCKKEENVIELTKMEKMEYKLRAQIEIHIMLEKTL